MKKKMAKAISILLVSLMLVAMFPAVFAAEPAEVTVSLSNDVFNASVWTVDGIEIDQATNTITSFNWKGVKNADGTTYGSAGGFRIPRAEISGGRNVFSVNVKAEAGTYAVYITPAMAGLGCSYGVWVDGVYAGRVDTRDTSLGENDYIVSDRVQLNTVYVTPDDDGWVNVKFENISTSAEVLNSWNSAISFTEFSLVPSEVATCTGISENISGKDLYVGKTAAFEVSATMSDGNTFKFDSADTETNNITAAVTAGDSVSLSNVAIGADGKLHGKIESLATTESTITVTVKLGEDTTTHEIKVTPKVFDGEDITVSMLASNFTTSGLSFTGNGSISDTSGYTITWNDDSAVFVREESSFEYFRQVYGLVDGKKPLCAWAAGRYSTVQFTFKTKIPFDGTYAISLTPILSQLGGRYGVWVNDQYAGSVNSWNGIAGTDSWTSTTTAGAEVQLNTLNLSADADGYVKIKLKNLSTVNDTTIADSYKDAYNTPVAFQDITFTPTDDLTVSSLSENITSTDIYNGKTSDFYIKAVMNDGQVHKFDTSDTSNEITASVPAGSAVALSDMVMKEDGLYGKITGVGEDEKATITVKTTINGVVDTKTINVVSFATEVKTPETVVISMKTTDVTHNKPNNFDYVKGSSEITWANNDKVRLDKENTNIHGFREYPYRANISYPYLSSPAADTEYAFAMKVRAVEGTYKVDLLSAYSIGGCEYEVFVDGRSVGTVDCSGNTNDASWTTVNEGAQQELGNVYVTPDADGWVSVKLKYLGDGANTTHATARAMFFSNITLTPTQKVFVTAETPSGMNNSLITCEGYTAGTIADVAFKSNLVLTATETETNKFLYWINNSTKQIISEEATLTLPVTSNATISAVYAESGNTRYDYFTSTGQRIESSFGRAPEILPEIPELIGYADGGEWSEDKSYETDDYVAYAPDYTNAAPMTFKATIDGVEETVIYDEEITVTANDANFSYWTKGGKLVSLMKSYTFFAWGDEAVEKVCGATVTSNDRKPQVVLFKRGNDYMLELVACEDVVVIEKGILFADSGTPTIGSAITKAKSNSDKKQFTASSTYSVARAYLVYRDGDDVKVVYSK